MYIKLFSVLERIKKHDNAPYIITLLIIGLILTVLLIDTKIISGHDSDFHIRRIFDISEALKAGTFPVRIYVDNGHYWGQPTGIFYPSFFIYFPALLNCFGIPVGICFNLLIISTFFCGLFSSWYGFAILTNSKKIGLLSAVLYISSGYYLFDAYVRSAVGELLSLAFMPLAFASVFCFVRKPELSVKMYCIAIFSISAVIESHVLTGALFLLVSSFYIIWHLAKQENTKTIMIRLTGLAVVIILINASFIIPFLVYYKNVPLTIDYVKNFSKTGWSFTIIKSFLFYWNFWLLSGLFISIFYRFLPDSFTSSPKRMRYSYFAKYFLAGLFFFWLSSKYFPWHLLPVLERVFRNMQFSWRFLGFSTLFFSVCAGYMLFHVLNKYIKIKPLLLFVLTFVICLTHFAGFNHFNFFPYRSWSIGKQKYWDSSHMANRTPWRSDYDYLYNDINRKALLRQGNRYISDAVITNYTKNLTTISFTYQTTKPANIILPLVNYPGYIAVDQYGNRIPLQKKDSNRMIVVPLTEKYGHIKVFYKGLPIFKVADYISFVSILLIVCIVIRTQMKRG